MLNKKLIKILLYIIAIMLIAEFLFIITMLIWGYFGTAPVAVYNAKAPFLITILNILTNIGRIIFFYVILGVMNQMLNHYKKVELYTRKSTPSVKPQVLNEKMKLVAEAPAKKAPVKKTTTKRTATKKRTTKRKTTKK